MGLEAWVLIITAASALITAFLAYRDEKRVHRRWFLFISFFLVIAAGVAGLEVLAQNARMKQVSEDVDRQWTIITDSPIDHLELEFLLADGAMSVEDLPKTLGGIRLAIQGVQLRDADKAADTVIDFSNYFTLSNIANASRAGIARSEVETETAADGKKVAKNVRSIWCTASHANVSRFTGTDAPVTQFCSLSFSVPVRSAVTANDIFKSNKISVAMPWAENVPCFGSCKNWYLSIRAVPQYQQSLISKDVVELSPTIQYNNLPNLFENNIGQFLVSGDSLSKLSEQHYKMSYGYHDSGPFPFTVGLLADAYQYLTVTTTRTGIMMGEVWSTKPNPTSKELTDAATPGAEHPEVFKLREWCGFGTGHACWHMFIVMDMPDK
jgi:hypothetical protein